MIPVEMDRHIAVLDRSRRSGPDLGFADVSDLGWQDDAVCAQADPELFFPEKGGSSESAKKICATCPVTAECLQYALDNDEKFGIWGGLTEIERRPLLRQTREAAA